VRSLITGAAGFAGSHLAEYRVNQGDDVIAVVREGDSLASLAAVQASLRVVHLDLRNAEAVSRLMQETRPQRIYHLASISSKLGRPEHVRSIFHDITLPNLNLLCGWRDAGFDARFLLVSSAEVYGATQQASMPLSEEAPISPATPYAAAKASSELLALLFHNAYGLPTVRVRPFNHTGPRQSNQFVCPALAKQVAEVAEGFLLPRIVVGNLSVRRDFCDVRDVVRGYSLLLEKGQPGEVYQLCSGRAVSIQEVLDGLLALAGKTIPVHHEQARVREDEAPALWGTYSRANAATGWSPAIDFATTLRDLLEYWQRRVRGDPAARP
jgi:GDP-4-dehydro-6-deoxy-D-mannose reductase